MNSISNKIFEEFQIRKTKKQKEKFRELVVSELSKYGYRVSVLKNGRSNNIVIGDIEKAGVLCTAHYDTQAVLPFPNLIVPNNLFGFILSQLTVTFFVFITAALVNLTFLYLLDLSEFFNNSSISDISFSLSILAITSWMLFGKANKHTANDNTSGVITIIEAAIKIPEKLRDDVCFVLFDNEEVGLLGSSAFAKDYGIQIANKLIINFDCVSDGDDIFFFPSKTMKNDKKQHESITKAFTSLDGKRVHINDGFGIYPSDNLNFKYAYGVCALKKDHFITSTEFIHLEMLFLMKRISNCLVKAYAI